MRAGLITQSISHKAAGAKLWLSFVGMHATFKVIRSIAFRNGYPIRVEFTNGRVGAIKLQRDAWVCEPGGEIITEVG